MTVGLPPHRVKYRELARDFETSWRFHHVEVEPWQNGIRPDVCLHHDDGILNVEILVHHKAGEEKIAALERRGQSCIEISLAGLDFDDTPGDELRDAILWHAPRQWLQHQYEAERVEIVKSQWRSKIAEMGLSLREAVLVPSHGLVDEVRARHEREFVDLDTEPFIGRSNPYSHWFSAPSKHWQHALLKDYLFLASSGKQRSITIQATLPAFSEARSMLNPAIPLEVSDEVLKAAGLDRISYGSPEAAISHYFETLCSEPDVVDYPGAAKRMLVWGEQPGLMVMHPPRVEYLARKDRISALYEKADRFRRKDFKIWLKRPLPLYSGSANHICLVGAEPYIRLQADLMAIQNMLNGGRPADNLLGILNERDRAESEASYNRPYSQGGGCKPYYKGVFKVCPSSDMMRRGVPLSRIINDVAHLAHDTAEQAEAFLKTPHRELWGFCPGECADNPAMLQFCINLIPVMPTLVRGGKRFRRIW